MFLYLLFKVFKLGDKIMSYAQGLYNKRKKTSNFLLPKQITRTYKACLNKTEQTQNAYFYTHGAGSGAGAFRKRTSSAILRNTAWKPRVCLN